MNYKSYTPTDLYRCPNCGAEVGYQDRCEYCGSRLHWKPTTVEFISMALNVETIMAEAVVDMLGAKPDSATVQQELGRLLAREAIRYADIYTADDPRAMQTHVMAKLLVVRRAK